MALGCLDRRRRRRRASGMQLVGKRLDERAPELAAHRRIGLGRHLQLTRGQLPHGKTGKRQPKASTLLEQQMQCSRREIYGG